MSIWEDTIKMHFQEMVLEGVDGTAVADCRKQWRICLNTV
jgi:hypothetical protein